MTRRLMILLIAPALAALSVLLTGCKASETDAVRAIEAKQYDRAERIYRQLLDDRPGDADLERKWKAARRLAAKQHHARVEDLLAAGDVNSAEREAEIALYLQPDNEAYLDTFSTVRGARRGTRSQIADAREAIEVKDWLRARRLLEPIRHFARTFREIEPLWKQVARENHRIAMREGLRHTKLLDYEEAARWYADAHGLLPDDPQADEAYATAVRRTNARRLAHQAEAQIEAGEFVAAVRASDTSVDLHATPYTRAVRLEAYRRAGLDLLARSRDARDAGELRDAYVLADEAHQLEVPQQRLGGEIAALHTDLGRALAARYVAAGLRAEGTGHMGAAWVYYGLAKKLRPSFPDIDLCLRRCNQWLVSVDTWHVVVLPAAHEGSRIAPGAGMMLAHSLREALETALPDHVATYSPDDLDGLQLRTTGRAPDAVLRGSVHELWLESPEPQVHEQSLEYNAGMVPELNRRIEQLEAEINRIETVEVPEAQRLIEEAKKNEQECKRQLEQAEATYRQGQGTRSRSQEEVAAAALYASRGIYVASQAFVRRREREARQLEQRIQELQQEYIAEPAYIDVPLMKTYRYPVATVQVDVSGRASAVCKDFVSGLEAGPIDVSTGFSRSDRTFAAFPLGGLEEDPLDLPPDDQLLRDATGRMARQMVDQLADSIRLHGRRYLHRARAAAEDDPVAALHYLALGWQAKHAMTDDDRREVLDRFRQLTGVDPTTGKLDLTRLPDGPLR